MRFLSILAIITFLLIPAAHGQTPIGKEQANAYYYNCAQKQDPRMSPETQTAFCACTSVQMMEAMNLEDIQAMAGQDQAARDALNKMLLDVYAPCMGYPVEELINTKCLSDPKLKALGLKKPKEEICGCMGNMTAGWFEQEGRTLLQSVLVKNPNITDPIEPVMESRTFKSQSYNFMIDCMTEEASK